MKIGSRPLGRTNETEFSGAVIPTRIALVGCGAVSQLYYVPALRQLETNRDIEVVAAYDPNPVNLCRVKKYFPAALALDTFDSVCERGTDLAIIASPPRFHAEQAIRALTAGLAVLCEKPMALTSADANAMIAAARNANKVLAIGLYRRFLPAAQIIKTILLSEALGKVESFDCFEGGHFEWPIASADFFAKKASNGGVLLDIGVHTLDLLIWWLGEPVGVTYEDDAMGGIDVNCRIQLTFSNGCMGEVRLSRDWPRPNRYLFQCSKGWLEWEVNEAQRVRIGIKENPFVLDARLRLRRGEEGLKSAAATPDFHRSFIDQIRNVTASARGEEKPVVSGEQGLLSLQLIERCYQTRQPMQMAWLSDAEQTRARQLAFKHNA
jgi:predicted dehydrogenase